MKGKKKSQKKQVKTIKKLVAIGNFAIENSFFLDAALIISRAMETRLKKVIETTEKRSPGAGFNLEQYLKRLKYLHLKPENAIIRESFELVLIGKLRGWKNSRNSILNDLSEIHVSSSRMEKLAIEGKSLLIELNSACKIYKTLLKKLPKTV
jgi:hypothetical protein